MKHSKLKTVFILLVSVSKITFAQINFVDVVPDSCVCVTSVPYTSVTLVSDWDLDGNSVNDFRIESFSNYQDCTHGLETTSITALGTNGVAGNIPSGGYVSAFMLNVGDTINNQPSWINSGYLRYHSLFWGFGGTYWATPAGTFKYAGVKFYAGTTLYYGWMRLSVETQCGSAKVIVSEYAYSTSLIKAGQGSVTGIEKHYVNRDISVYPNPNNGSFKVELANGMEDAEILLINSLGQNVKTQKLAGGTNLISTSGLPAGIYSYILLQNNLSVSKGKLSLE